MVLARVHGVWHLIEVGQTSTRDLGDPAPGEPQAGRQDALGAAGSARLVPHLRAGKVLLRRAVSSGPHVVSDMPVAPSGESGFHWLAGVVPDLRRSSHRPGCRRRPVRSRRSRLPAPSYAV